MAAGRIYRLATSRMTRGWTRAGLSPGRLYVHLYPQVGPSKVRLTVPEGVDAGRQPYREGRLLGRDLINTHPTRGRTTLETRRACCAQAATAPRSSYQGERLTRNSADHA